MAARRRIGDPFHDAGRKLVMNDGKKIELYVLPASVYKSSDKDGPAGQIWKQAREVLQKEFKSNMYIILDYLSEGHAGAGTQVRLPSLHDLHAVHEPVFSCKHSHVSQDPVFTPLLQSLGAEAQMLLCSAAAGRQGGQCR